MPPPETSSAGAARDQVVHRVVQGPLCHDGVVPAPAYTRGLLAPLERKNGWPVAEEAGHGGPDRMQRLLNRIGWDANGVLDDVRAYARGPY